MNPRQQPPISAEPVASPSVGIVIPCYNLAGLVAATIESALAQTYDDVRIVVVDDGSKDDSLSIIERYRGRVEILSQENRGQANACFAGWDLLDTEIVFFLDADDLLVPDAAAAVVAAWRPGVAKVQFRMEVIDDSGQPTGSIFPKFPPDTGTASLRRELLRTGLYPTPPTSGNAYSSDLVQAMVEAPRTLTIDSILNLAAPLHGDVVSLSERLAFYRVHSTNAWMLHELDLKKVHYRFNAEIRRAHYLAGLCRARGLAFDPDQALRNMLSHQEHRLALTRFGDGDGRLPAVLRDNLRAIMRSPYGWKQRLLRSIWVMLVAVLPRSAATSLLLQRMTPTKRSVWFERLLGWFLKPTATAQASNAIGK